MAAGQMRSKPARPGFFCLGEYCHCSSTNVSLWLGTAGWEIGGSGFCFSRAISLESVAPELAKHLMDSHRTTKSRQPTQVAVMSLFIGRPPAFVVSATAI